MAFSNLQSNSGRGTPVPSMILNPPFPGSLLIAGKVFRGSPAGETCASGPFGGPFDQVWTKHQLSERNVDGAAGCTVVMYWRIATGTEEEVVFGGGAGAGVTFVQEWAVDDGEVPELTDASEGTSSNGSGAMVSGNMFPTAGKPSLVVTAAGVTVPDVAGATMTTDAPAVEHVDLMAAAALQPLVWMASRKDAAAAPPIQITGAASVALESYAVQVMAFTAEDVPGIPFMPRFW